MDHRQYEDWLLDDERLTADQDRELRIHLRSCPTCNTLAQANLSLRSSAVIAPAPGFTLRFQVRLAAQRKVERRRTSIGLFLLAIVGISGLLWLLFPYLPYMALPPERLVSLWISNLVSLALTARALSAFGNTILSVLGSSIPTNVLVLALLVMGALGIVCSVTFRKTGKISQSAT